MDNINVFFLPMNVHGCVTPNADGSYTIFINANDSYEMQRKTFKHEMKHIKGNDFEIPDVQVAELKVRIA